MRIIRRLLALLLSLAVMAVFYVIAIMMESEETKRTDEFVVEAPSEPLTPIAAFQSQDAQQLADSFGAPVPLPEGFTSGGAADKTYHTYKSRIITLQGTAATVTGVRPAAAAPSIMPKDAVFLAGSKALLGYPLLEAQREGGLVFALHTPEAAFLITPLADAEPGGFSLLEPRP